MSAITPEELAAWADGEITGERADEIAAAVAADPALQAKVEAHRALKGKLVAHFAPIADAPVPDRFAQMLQPQADIVDFGTAKARIAERRRLPRWSWVVGPALAASLVLAVVLPRGDDDAAAGYADLQLASALDTQLVAEQGAAADTRILLSFQNEGGEFCRAFAAGEAGGIACRDDAGWRLDALGAAAGATGTEYQQAGAADILAAAQEMAAGPALDAEAERAARDAGWR